MTYLELVNAVLGRLREDLVLTVSGSDDVVVELVRGYVNDAKQVVESAYNWSALETEWTFDTTPGQNKVASGIEGNSVVDVIYDSEGREIRQINKNDMRKRALSRPTANTPQYYAINGATAGKYQIQLWPTPKDADTFYVYGYRPGPDLKADSDVLLVPSTPVIYLALAYAARERGETGAQSMGELLSMAQQYLMDAIARDASNHGPDNIWTTV